MSNQTFQDLKDTFDPHPDPYSLLPDWSLTSALPRVPFITVHDGFVCSACGHCALNFQDTMKRHFREDHAVVDGQGQDPLMAMPGQVQQLFYNTKEPFFLVREVDQAPTVDAWSLFKAKADELKVTPPLAVRNYDLHTIKRTAFDATTVIVYRRLAPHSAGCCLHHA
jgi:hypothetical protein